MSSTSDELAGQERAAAWYLKGLRAAADLPAVVLGATFIGIGSVAADFGLPLIWTALGTLLIWAGPAHLILIGGIGSGAPWAAIAIAISLSSVRLMPMVVSILPYIRAGTRNPFKLALAAHLVAISLWVEGQRLLPGLPPRARAPFFFGLATGLLSTALLATILGHLAAPAIPRPFAIGLLFLTPIFFLLSLFRTATARSDQFAVVGGFVGFVLASYVDEGLALLWAGVGGGTLAYLAARVLRRGAAP